MKLNKFKKSLLLIVSIISIFGITSYNSQKYSSSVNINNSNIKDNNMLSMMLETSAGSGEYKETTASAWPTDGYEFNETLSKCEKGSSLSWDSTKNTVVMMGNNADKCYVYFNIKMPPLSDFIKSLYTNQGENNLYLHDSTLSNGANDNSYRYAGSSETTNNFVCFGYDSTDGTCPTDYLYRIIGVFDNQVKLIKYDYAKSTLLGTDGDYLSTYSGAGMSSSTYGTSKGSNTKDEIGVYRRNTINQIMSSNIWSESRLNTINLNTNYLSNIGTGWSKKISTHTWQVGGNTKYNIVAYVFSTYQNEIATPAEETSYDAKIGLMYVSDYGYAASSNFWATYALEYRTSGLSYSNTSVTNENWMYMGLSEWTITRQSDDSNAAFYVYHTGYVPVNASYGDEAIRPVFYLNSNVTYVSGNGTKNEPFIIN